MTPIAESLLDFIRVRGQVSMVEIEAFLESQGADVKGDKALMIHPDYPSILAWLGINDTFCALLQEIMPYTTPTPRSFLVYVIDGTVPNLPLAKQKRQYKTDRWLPVVLNAANRAPDY